MSSQDGQEDPLTILERDLASFKHENSTYYEAVQHLVAAHAQLITDHRLLREELDRARLLDHKSEDIRSKLHDESDSLSVKSDGLADSPPHSRAQSEISTDDPRNEHVDGNGEGIHEVGRIVSTWTNGLARKDHHTSACLEHKARTPPSTTALTQRPAHQSLQPIALPHKLDPRNENMIPLNKDGHRLDLPMNLPTQAQFKAYTLRNKRQPICHYHHSTGYCTSGSNCKYDHGAISPDVKIVLSFLAHDIVCNRRGECRIKGCCFAHVCYKTGCESNSCKLAARFHNVDMRVVKWVPAVQHRNMFEQLSSVRSDKLIDEHGGMGPEDTSSFLGSTVTKQLEKRGSEDTGSASSSVLMRDLEGLEFTAARAPQNDSEPTPYVGEEHDLITL